MTRKSIIEREKKKNFLFQKYFETRKNFLIEIKKKNILEDKFLYIKKLQKLPKNSSHTRLRNRCWKTGRSRGFLRFFGLCRTSFRELAHSGMLPGVIKASW